jgi:hypothetical protein
MLNVGPTGEQYEIYGTLISSLWDNQINLAGKHDRQWTVILICILDLPGYSINQETGCPN